LLELAHEYLKEPTLWQHDLPLGQISEMSAVFFNRDYSFASNISDDVRQEFESAHALAVADAADHDAADTPQTWHDQLVAWALPATYNPSKLIGESRTWESKPDEHIYTGVLPATPPHPMIVAGVNFEQLAWSSGWSMSRAVKREGPGLKAYANALFQLSGGRDIKLEACGLDLLFPVALMRYWVRPGTSKIDDSSVPILPYLGAGGWQPTWSAAFDNAVAPVFGPAKYVTVRPSSPPFALRIETSGPYVTWGSETEWNARRSEWRRDAQVRDHIAADRAGEDNRALDSEELRPRTYMRQRIPDWRSYDYVDWLTRPLRTWHDVYRFRGWRNYSAGPELRVVTMSVRVTSRWEYWIEASNAYAPMAATAATAPYDSVAAGVLASTPLTLLSGQTGIVNAFGSLIREHLDPGIALVHFRLKALPSLGRFVSRRMMSRLVTGGALVTTCDVVGSEVFDMPRVRYGVNMRSLVIHDLLRGHRNHIAKAARGYQLLALPIAADIELLGRSIDEVVALLNAHPSAPPGYWDELATTVRRRDHTLEWCGRAGRAAAYEMGPPPRLKRYLDERPGRARDYEVKNAQRLRLCSYCFSRTPAFPAPY
jgi:hypothetical protein